MNFYRLNLNDSPIKPKLPESLKTWWKDKHFEKAIFASMVLKNFINENPMCQEALSKYLFS